MNYRMSVGFALAFIGFLILAIGADASRGPHWRVRPIRRGGGNRRLLIALMVGLIALAVTRWPVLALLAAFAVAGLPSLLGDRRSEARQIARLQSIADWTRRLADVLVAGMGIEQALVSSARVAPPPIETEVAALAAHLRARRPLEECLRKFADALDDPTGDLVAAALLLASRRRGHGLAQVLTSLASTVESQVAMRRAVEADRAQPRTTMRYVAWITIAVVLGLLLLDRQFVEPFGTPAGQAVLALIGLVFAGGFAWMRALTVGTPLHRFLNGEPQGSGSVRT